MSHSYADPEQLLNPSAQPSITDLIAARVTRRDFLKVAGAFTALAALPLAGCATSSGGSAAPGFQSVAVSTADTVIVPEGYSARVLYAWGDPIGHAAGSPAFKPDASNTAAEQALQAGMHHDGIHFFPLPYGSNAGSSASNSGLLVMNHEYTDDGLLHVGGFANWSAEKVRKSQNASGCSVIEVRAEGGQWMVVRPSQYARRVTSNTPMGISGPAAGHVLMKTEFDASGREVLGTVNNCAMGYTPWGTYLTCEENWDTVFVNSGRMLPDHVRNGIVPKGRGYRWEEFDVRFDAGKHPNEPNRFGWVVEIDPYEPQAKPVKRTALGRCSHEGATTVLTADGRLAVYLGDDRQFEYIYKFVSRDKVNTGDRKANATLLDHGTLYVAKFNEDGSGTWMPVVHGQGRLTVENGFNDQGEVLINTRAAADALGATPMDRPEWIAVHPQTKEVYCTLTNNTRRGADKAPAVNAMNPRANNVYGHIIRWNETGGDPAALAFRWDIFVLAGDAQQADAGKKGNIKGDAFGSPDGLWFDAQGRLWIQTDVSTSVLNRGDYANLGNNMMLAADVSTGDIRRFLTGPRGCEITGVVTTPDGRTMFVNIQHPGETSSERNDPAQPQAVSTWPDGPAGGRPRSATVVIRRLDGGVVGT
jgi:secreted PhoX family phosphatase